MSCIIFHLSSTCSKKIRCSFTTRWLLLIDTQWCEWLTWYLRSLVASSTIFIIRFGLSFGLRVVVQKSLKRGMHRVIISEVAPCITTFFPLKEFSKLLLVKSEWKCGVTPMNVKSNLPSFQSGLLPHGNKKHPHDDPMRPHDNPMHPHDDPTTPLSLQWNEKMKCSALQITVLNRFANEKDDFFKGQKIGSQMLVTV